MSCDTNALKYRTNSSSVLIESCLSFSSSADILGTNSANDFVNDYIDYCVDTELLL